MDDESLAALGHWCENLLENEFFKFMVQQYEVQCFNHIVNTEPKNLKEREHIYIKMRALQDFVGHLKATVIQKDTLVEKSREEQLSQSRDADEFDPLGFDCQ